MLIKAFGGWRFYSRIQSSITTIFCCVLFLCFRGEWVCTLCRNVEKPEVEYDCENTRYGSTLMHARAPFGLDDYDQKVSLDIIIGILKIMTFSSDEHYLLSKYTRARNHPLE